MLLTGKYRMTRWDCTPLSGLICSLGKRNWQLKFARHIGPKRPTTTHRRQRHRPKYVGKILLPARHPFALHAHMGGGQGGLVPFQQNQIGPPGIVPAGRFENLMLLGGMNETLGSEVGAGKKAGLLGVLPVGRLGEAE